MPLPTALDLAVFQGPLDLLLTLVERRQLAITEVSLALVTDQYLEAVRALPEPDPDLLSEFLVIGAQLLLLKSRALLPQAVEVDEEPPLDDLAARLEEYRQVKQIAEALAQRLSAGSQAYRPQVRPELEPIQPPLAPIEAQVLARIWRSICQRQPAPKVDPDRVVRPRVRVADRLAYLRERLAVCPVLRWEEIAGQTLDEIIATFLAVLEMVRRGELRARQEERFGPILLLASNAEVPIDSQHAGEAEQRG